MANTTADDWDESSPALSDPRRQGAAEITSLRAGVADRLAKEHVTPDEAGVGGEHLEGSARVYYSATAPTKRPDGVTDLDADDEGRVWWESDTKLQYVWSGAAWILPQANNARGTGDGAPTYTLPQSFNVDNGVWIAFVYGVVTSAGTISVTVEGTTRSIAGAALGAPFCLPFQVTVADTTLTVSASSGCNVQGVTYFRVG